MFDRLPDPNAGAHQLTFRKEEILFIDNTMYNGTPGHWSAWLVDVDGQRGEWGVVPSKYKVCKQPIMTGIEGVVESRLRSPCFQLKRRDFVTYGKIL